MRMSDVDWVDVKTSEEAIEWMMSWWSGDSGVSCAEIEGVLRDFKKMVLKENKSSENISQLNNIE